LESRFAPATLLLQVLCLVVLLLMAAALIYTGWIALSDYSRIGV
jgi:hypothetical protein